MRLTLALFLALFVLGCESGTGGGKRPPQTTAQLHITIWPHGESGASACYTLSCPGGRGTFPAARSACSKLSHLDASVFKPVPIGTACTEIYGGPQVATVRGKLDGDTIDASFNRSNGCEIARWQQLGLLLGSASRP